MSSRLAFRRFQSQSILVRGGGKAQFYFRQQMQHHHRMMMSTMRSVQGWRGSDITTTYPTSFNKNNKHDGWMWKKNDRPSSCWGYHSTSQIYEEENNSSSGKDTLLDILERERAEEEMNSATQMPDELVELKKLISKDWKIVEEKDAALIRMVRSSGGGDLNLKVQVSFHCQDVVENDSSMYPELEDEDQSDNDDEEPSMPIRFTVIASKAGKTMVFSCLSVNAMAQIQSVALTSSDDEMSLLKKGSVPAHEYQGPEYFELAQDLQEAFATFLEVDVGINEDVSSFIAMYADYKEQEQYVQFLEHSKRILS